MRQATQDFATALLDHARTSGELEVMLNYNPNGDIWEPGERHTLERLKLAIKYKQKKVLLYIFFFFYKIYHLENFSLFFFCSLLLIRTFNNF